MYSGCRGLGSGLRGLGSGLGSGFWGLGSGCRGSGSGFWGQWLALRERSQLQADGQYSPKTLAVAAVQGLDSDFVDAFAIHFVADSSK